MSTNNHCYSCNYCYYCNSCYYCYYCYSCYYCKNLKMTECNIFCYSKMYDDDDSFQQKRYRAFNQEVGESRYKEIKFEIKAILEGFELGLNDSTWSKEWEKVTSDQWRQLLIIPEAKDFKKGFEYIAGIEIDLEPELDDTTVEAMELLKGAGYKIVKEK